MIRLCLSDRRWECNFLTNYREQMKSFLMFFFLQQITHNKPYLIPFLLKVQGTVIFMEPLMIKTVCIWIRLTSVWQLTSLISTHLMWKKETLLCLQVLHDFILNFFSRIFAVKCWQEKLICGVFFISEKMRARTSIIFQLKISVEKNRNTIILRTGIYERENKRDLSRVFLLIV